MLPGSFENRPAFRRGQQAWPTFCRSIVLSGLSGRRKSRKGQRQERSGEETNFAVAQHPRISADANLPAAAYLLIHVSCLTLARVVIVRRNKLQEHRQPLARHVSRRNLALASS